MCRSRSSSAREDRSGSMLGEEAAEVGEAGRDAGHRLLPTSRSLALEVGDEGRPQGCSDVGHALLVALGSLPVRRRCLDDLEVEQHPVRTAERRAVVALSFPGRLLPLPTRRLPAPRSPPR